MPLGGWKRLLSGWPWFAGEGNYPIPAYSEFMPPPRLGMKPYAGPPRLPHKQDDPYGWYVTEIEEHLELRPGLDNIAEQIIRSLYCLGSGRADHGFSRTKLADNPYWPDELSQRAGQLGHERFVVLLPLALSRTQDDKGRVRWTLFGGSEQGPAQAFWRGFYSAPNRELPEEEALAFFRSLLHAVYSEPIQELIDLRRAGLRILPLGDEATFPVWREQPLPRWTAPLLWRAGEPISRVKYVLTFRPFGQLPLAIRRAYLSGSLHLLPFPGSLVYWGVQPFHRLQQELPMAIQIPLLHEIHRNENWRTIRVPQSGWLREGKNNHSEVAKHHGPIRNTFKRTNRWSRVLRHADELALIEREDPLTHVLFSSLPDDLGLYGKPLARNVQIWSSHFEALFDGPRASPDQLESVRHRVLAGGTFGYRFQYPPMQVGRHEVYWHRPLFAYRDPKTGEAVRLADGPLGYLTSYLSADPDLENPVELWPRLLQRQPYLDAVNLADHANCYYPFQTALNVWKVLDASLSNQCHPLSQSLARELLTTAKNRTFREWVDLLPTHAPDNAQGRRLVEAIQGCTRAEHDPLPEAITYEHTARRSFEVNYWKTIVSLAEGKYLTKNNADCVRDAVTQKHLSHLHRDLDAFGSYLLAYYQKLVAKKDKAGRVLVGELPFRWETEFNYEWMGGWQENQEGKVHERDLIVVIPGRDRRHAVIMADHYDTAFMADLYAPQYGGDGARLAAAGADDNCSATAALMLGMPLFLELSRAGRLACDVWLVHLTGEEYPADCLGARNLSQWLVEGTLKMRLANGSYHDLSKTRIQGVYVLDMIAHNNSRDLDTFQISPGNGPASFWLAQQAHTATEIWNANTKQWNQRTSRRDRGRGRRSPHGGAIPEIARHPSLHGEIRPSYDPRSVLYNTDGQIFSDAGIPVVLFMENYDINRAGYHDSHDTMANIDLDYGAALAAITIESVARAASVVID